MAAKFKVVGFAKMSQKGMDVEKKELAALGFEVDVIEARPRTEDDLIGIAADADVVLGGHIITKRVIDSLKKCRMVCTYSVGYDGIDVEAATAAGIIICNNPASGWCVEEVSNQAITLVLVCAKKFGALRLLVRDGRWADSRKVLYPMGSIYGETLGLVGAGEIGRLTAKKAQAFGMKVIAYSPHVPESVAVESGIELVDLPDVLKHSDYISVHTPLSAKTHHLIGEREIAMMKPTACIVNTARGSIIDESALIRALQDKRIAGAGLDVFEQEPIDPANPLLKMDNVVAIPHTASYSERAIELQPIPPARNAVRVLSGKWPMAVLNPIVKPRVPLEK